MKCPFCSYRDSRVVDSRAVDDGVSIRRRRECPDCGRRFTTYEKYEETPLVVSKKDSRRELFDAKKLLNGLSRLSRNGLFLTKRSRRSPNISSVNCVCAVKPRSGARSLAKR